MYAPKSVTSDQLSTQRRRRRQHHTSQSRFGANPLWELSAKLLVNGLLTVAAGTSLARLVPYLQSQTQALQVATAELAVAEQQTAHLRSDFERYFDPSQAKDIMQEQTGWESPNERQIVWIDPTKDLTRPGSSQVSPQMSPQVSPQKSSGEAAEGSPQP